MVSGMVSSVQQKDKSCSSTLWWWTTDFRRTFRGCGCLGTQIAAKVQSKTVPRHPVPLIAWDQNSMSRLWLLNPTPNDMDVQWMFIKMRGHALKNSSSFPLLRYLFLKELRHRHLFFFHGSCGIRAAIQHHQSTDRSHVSRNRSTVLHRQQVASGCSGTKTAAVVPDFAGWLV